MNFSDYLALPNLVDFKRFCDRFGYNYRSDLAFESYNVFNFHKRVLITHNQNKKLMAFVGLNTYTLN